MKIVDNTIVECTRGELYRHYIKHGFDSLYSFPDYMELCKVRGTKIIEIPTEVEISQYLSLSEFLEKLLFDIRYLDMEHNARHLTPEGISLLVEMRADPRAKNEEIWADIKKLEEILGVEE